MGFDHDSKNLDREMAIENFRSLTIEFVNGGHVICFLKVIVELYMWWLKATKNSVVSDPKKIIICDWKNVLITKIEFFFIKFLWRLKGILIATRFMVTTMIPILVACKPTLVVWELLWFRINFFHLLHGIW